MTTADKPAADWYKPSFDDGQWKTGKSPVGSGLPGGIAQGTDWNDTPGDIWLRRTLTLPNRPITNPNFMLCHDEDTEIYINGVLALSEAGYNGGYEAIDALPAARALLKPGATISLAVHFRQTTGGQGFDMGLANVIQP